MSLLLLFAGATGVVVPQVVDVDYYAAMSEVTGYAGAMSEVTGYYAVMRRL
jgi:hypothetical protein